MKSITITWGRQNYRLHEHQGGWRLRSRAAGDAIDAMFYGTPRKVKTAVATWLDTRQPRKTKAEKATLEDVVKAYREMPKRAGKAAEDINVYRLKAVVRDAWGRSLDLRNESASSHPTRVITGAAKMHEVAPLIGA